MDGTVGGAGHSCAILEQTDAFLVGMDCDERLCSLPSQRLAAFGSRKVLIKGKFCRFGIVLEDLNIEKVDGVLLDLGVSSHQLDKAQRGFSFSQSSAA